MSPCSDDFCGDVILHALFSHPLLKCLIRFKRGPDSLMCTDDRADALSRYFEPRFYQRNRAHLCLPGPCGLWAKIANQNINA